MRIKNKLTPLALKKINHPGRYSDGNNLYLKVEETQFNFTLDQYIVCFSYEIKVIFNNYKYL